MTKKDKRLEVPGFILERTAKRMKRSFQQLLKANHYDITADQWVILQELQKRNGMNQLELGQATFKDAPTVTRIIDLLDKKGLIQRVSDPDDRRRFRIVLTDKGQATITEILPLAREYRRAAWSGLSEHDITELVRMLNQVFDNLDHEPDQ